MSSAAHLNMLYHQDAQHAVPASQPSQPLAEKQDFASTIASTTIAVIWIFFFTMYEYVDFFFFLHFLNFFLIKLYFL